MSSIITLLLVHAAYAEVDVSVRFDTTFAYDFPWPSLYAAKHNFSRAYAECEPQQTRTCLTKICVGDDSAWSGLKNCTCDGEVMTPPRHSPLDAMRRAWKESSAVPLEKPMNTTESSPQLILFDERELWQIDLYSGTRRKIAEGSIIELASDFDFWYSKKAVIMPRFHDGVRMCNITMGNGTDALSLRCKCDFSCAADTFEQLDSTATPSMVRVALDWIHGTYYWAGHELELSAVGVYDVATKRRRVLFSGLTSHIRPTEIEVDPVDGFLFWIDLSRHAIVRADTDGRNLKVRKNPGIPSSWYAAIPVHHNSILLAAVASTDYDGNAFRVVLQSCHFVDGFHASLALVDDRVFWTNGDALLSVAKAGGERGPRIHYVAKSEIKSLKVWHGPSQPEGQNKCDGHRCVWMCLPRRSDAIHSARNSSVAEDRLSYSCACPQGQRSVWRDDTNFCVDDSSKRKGIVVPL